MQLNTYCRLCDGSCGLFVEADSERITGFLPDRGDPVSQGFLCDTAKASGAVLDHPERITRPMRRVDGRLIPASWDEAVKEIGEQLRAIRGRSGARGLGLYLGDEVQRSSYSMLRALAFGVGVGTPNIFSTFAAGAGPRVRMAELMLGHPVVLLPDLGRAHFVLLLNGDHPRLDWGAQNPGMAHEAWIKHSRKTKGTKVVVADARRTPLAEEVDQHLPIRPGTEPFLLLGMANAIHRGDWVDAQFIRDYTVHRDRLDEALDPWTVERCAEICGIAPALLSGVALKFARSAMGAIHPGPGTFRNINGSAAAWAWMVLHTLTANTLRPGGIYDHRGIFDLHYAYAAVPSEGSPRTRVGDHPLVLLQAPGTALGDEILTPGEGQLRALITVAGDPVADLPGSPRTREALDALELLVCLARFPDETTQRAHWVLPLTHSWEQEDLHLLDASLLPALMTQRTPAVVAARGEARPAEEVLRELYAAVHPGLRGSVWGRHLGLLARYVAKTDLSQATRRISEWIGDVDWTQLEQPPFRIHQGDVNRANWRVSRPDNRIDLVPDGIMDLLARVEVPQTGGGFDRYLRTSTRVDRAPDHWHRGEVAAPTVRLHPDAGLAAGAAVRVRTPYGEANGVVELDEALRADAVDVLAGTSLDARALLGPGRGDPFTGAPEEDGLICRVDAV